MLVMFLSAIGPGPVNNVRVRPLVLSMVVIWMEPLETSPIIVKYEVTLHEDLGAQQSTMVTVLTTRYGTDIVIAGLKPNTTYNISVTAFTHTGVGPPTTVKKATLSIRK